MTPDKKELLEQISRDIVSDVAPEELELFDDLAQEYYDDPAPQTEEVTRGGALSFGSLEMMQASTPVIMAVITVVLEFLLDILQEMVASQGADIATKKIRMWFTRKERADLTASQINRIRQAALDEAIRHGLPAAEAESIADATMKRLITG